MHLRRKTIGGNSFVELVVAHDFAAQVHVASAFDDREPCLVGVDVLQLIVEHRFHRCPSVGSAVGHAVDLNRFDEIVIQIRTCEAIADAARREQDEHAAQDQEAQCSAVQTGLVFNELPHSAAEA